MKLKTLGHEPNIPLLHNAKKIVELLAQDVKDIQEGLVESKRYAPWQTTSMSNLRQSVWHLFLDHVKCEYILTKAHEYGLNWHEDVLVELFGEAKDYIKYIDALFVVFQGCPMRKVDNSWGILLSYDDGYGEWVVDEDEYQKWNNFTPNPAPSNQKISWNYEEPNKEQDDKIKELSDIDFFEEKLTPEHFIEPSKTKRI